MDKQIITLYTGKDCSRCSLVKMMLDFNNVDYEEISDKQAMIDKGIEFIPAIESSGKIIDTYPLVLDWLKQNNYYSF